MTKTQKLDLLRQLWVACNIVEVGSFVILFAILVYAKATDQIAPMSMVYPIFTCLGAAVFGLIPYEEHNARADKPLTMLDFFNWSGKGGHD